MKKLGLIGGMGPQSTVPYYMNIVYGVQQRTSPRFFPNITIESLNVFEILDMIADKQYDMLSAHFLKAIERLKAADAEIVALTANTAHIVYDRLIEQSPLPIVSIIDATVAEACRRGLTRIGLLGTSFTMEMDFYKNPFEKAGIEVVIPTTDERTYIDNKISSELEYGIISSDTQRVFADIIERMTCQDGIEAIVLACTELPIILNDSISAVPCLDTVKIHTSELVNQILD